MAVQLLQQAFIEVSKLPEHEQEAVAAWILAELASEKQWDEAFASSADALGQLADEAIAEFRAGRTHPLNPKRL